jgi:IclR family transcriptional regulator, acetate operon repressor
MADPDLNAESSREQSDSAYRPPFGVMRTARAPDSAQHVSRALQALELLAFQSLSVPQVADALQIHPRTARRLLSGLATEGYIEQTFDSRRRYRSTLRLAALGAEVIAHAELPRTAAPYVALLSARTGSVAHLVIASHRGAVCVVHTPAGHDAELPAPALGEVLPPHATAPGKVLLAHRQPWLGSVLSEPATRYTDRTLTSMTDIEAAMSTIRARGYAIEDGEYRPKAVGIAAPVFANDDVPAALAITTTTEAAQRRGMDDLIGEVSKAALALTQTLGGQPPSR